MTGSRVFALSVHADYACRHSGACCTAGWHIPVEPEIRDLFHVEVLSPEPDGACRYYDRGARRCSIHRDHGAAMLPSSCAHFPRRVLTDDRGTFVTLSHFCPTAAQQLFRTDRPLQIVENPEAFPCTREFDGLDGRATWPPLLRPGVMFDHDSYTRWEEFVVAAFAEEHRSAREALHEIAAAGEELRAWTPSRGTFRDWTERILVSGADRRAVPEEIRGLYGVFADVRVYERVADTVPDGLAAPVLPRGIDALLAEFVEPVWHEWQTPVRRYLAAKAFGSWCAYQAEGVRTLVAELMASDMVLRVEAARASSVAGRRLDRGLTIEAIRAADWLLVHLADRTALTGWLGQVEHACTNESRGVRSRNR